MAEFYRDNTIALKSKAFALRIVKLYQISYRDTKRIYILSKQVLRSGTSIGANIKEGLCGQSTADFLTKMYVALKEASETEYWLELLHESGYIEDAPFESIYADVQELLKLLVSITKSSRLKLQQSKNTL